MKVQKLARTGSVILKQNTNAITGTVSASNGIAMWTTIVAITLTNPRSSAVRRTARKAGSAAQEEPTTAASRSGCTAMGRPTAAMEAMSCPRTAPSVTRRETSSARTSAASPSAGSVTLRMTAVTTRTRRRKYAKISTENVQSLSSVARTRSVSLIGGAATLTTTVQISPTKKTVGNTHASQDTSSASQDTASKIALDVTATATAWTSQTRRTASRSTRAAASARRTSSSATTTYASTALASATTTPMSGSRCATTGRATP